MHINYLNYKNKGMQRFANMLFTVLCISILMQGNKMIDIPNIITLSILLIGGAIVILSNNIKVFYESSMVFFCIMLTFLMILISFVNPRYFDCFMAWKGTFNFYVFILIAFIYTSLTSKNNKYWIIVNRISDISVFILFIQLITFKILGIELHNLNIYGNLLFNAVESGVQYRPSAFFSEPSHLAEFLLLSYYYYLYIDRNLKRICLYSVAIVISTSGLGIVGALFLLSLYFFTFDKNISFNGFSKILLMLIRICLIFIMMFVFVVIYGFMIESNHWLIQRLVKGATIEVRVFRSFDIFRRMDTFEKFFGVGLQNQGNYLNHYAIISKYDTPGSLINREYAQTIGYILVTTGVIGIISYMLGWVKIIFNYNYKIKILVFLFLFLCLASNMLTRNIYILFLIMI